MASQYTLHIVHTWYDNSATYAWRNDGGFSSWIPVHGWCLGNINAGSDMKIHYQGRAGFRDDIILDEVGSAESCISDLSRR